MRSGDTSDTLTEDPQIAPRQRRILVADTDSDSRIIVASIVAVLGHLPVVVESGEDALLESQNGELDLAILDYTIPDIDGLKICSAIKAHRRGDFIPVLMLTERDTVRDKVAALAGGVDDYLTKPFNYEELRARISAMLRIRDLHHQLKLANQELQLAQERLIEQERQLAVGQLAGAAAHQLGQPLSAILLNCFLIEQLPKGDVKFGGALEGIKRDVQRMAEMINKLGQVRASEREEYMPGGEILRFK
jgi:DNA-binding response OmpR family regulator